MRPSPAIFGCLLALFLSTSAFAAIAAYDDLSVSWISRTPKIDYVWESSRPTIDGWPEEGADVTWVAHVRWLGAAPREGVAYRWLINGQTVRTGTLDFPAASHLTTELPWKWTRTRHEIRFELDPGQKMAEFEERNNSLLIHTDAIGIGLYVERGFWDAILERVVETRIGAVTFDDWMQKNVRRFNEMARVAIYADSPNGVLERWRIDEIHLVEDGALPLTDPLTEARDWGASRTSYGTLFPNVADHTVDIQWGFPASTKGYYPFTTPWVFTIGNSLLHEFAHARTMIDVYAWNLDHAEDVIPMAFAPPANPAGRVHSTPHQGLMHFDWGHIDDYSAAAMNVMAGRRAIAGNYNEPWDLGWFLNDFPKQSRIRFVRPDGTALANRSVKIFRSTGPRHESPPHYRQVYNKTPDVTVATDANGEVVLSGNPISPLSIIARVDQTNGTAIVEIDDGGIRRWTFLESLDFNMAYWRGETEEARFEVMTEPALCSDQLGPSQVKPDPEALVTTRVVPFEISGINGQTYDLFYQIGDGPTVSVPVSVVSRGTGSIALELAQGRVVWWFVGRTAERSCPVQRSSIYGFDHIIPERPRPARR